MLVRCIARLRYIHEQYIHECGGRHTVLCIAFLSRFSVSLSFSRPFSVTRTPPLWSSTLSGVPPSPAFLLTIKILYHTQYQKKSTRNSTKTLPHTTKFPKKVLRCRWPVWLQFGVGRRRRRTQHSARKARRPACWEGARAHTAQRVSR